MKEFEKELGLLLVEFMKLADEIETAQPRRGRGSRRAQARSASSPEPQPAYA